MFRITSCKRCCKRLGRASSQLPTKIMDVFIKLQIRSCYLSCSLQRPKLTLSVTDTSWWASSIMSRVVDTLGLLQWRIKRGSLRIYMVVCCTIDDLRGFKVMSNRHNSQVRAAQKRTNKKNLTWTCMPTFNQLWWTWLIWRCQMRLKWAISDTHIKQLQSRD